MIDGAGCCGSLQLRLVGCTWVALATNEGAPAVGMGADVAPNVLCLCSASTILLLGGSFMSGDLFGMWMVANVAAVVVYCWARYVMYWRPRPRRELRRHPGAAAHPVLDKVLGIK